MMNKKAFLKAYKDVDKLTPKAIEPESKPIYRSEKDESLIKAYHYAKFQKNLAQAQQDSLLKELVEKDDWGEDDVQKFLSLLR